MDWENMKEKWGYKNKSKVGLVEVCSEVKDLGAMITKTVQSLFFFLIKYRVLTHKVRVFHMNEKVSSITLKATDWRGVYIQRLS